MEEKSLIKTVIIDDEQQSRVHLERLLDLHSEAIQLVGSAGTADEARDLINERKPDVVFLDIRMSRMSGFEFLESSISLDFLVVFVTSHEYPGIEATRTEAVDYIAKPIGTAALERAVSRVVKTWEEKSRSRHLPGKNGSLQAGSHHGARISPTSNIILRYADGFHLVNLANIVRMEADNTYTTIYLSEGKQITTSRAIKKFETLLDPVHFVRVHRSHIVHLRHVAGFSRKDGASVILSNGDHVPVSRRKLPGFRERVLDYVNIVHT